MPSGNRRPVIHPSANPSIFTGPTIVSGGTFTQQVNGSNGKGAFERLLETSALAAFHNSADRFDPPKCPPNTRIAVLKRITDWVLGTSAEPRECRAFMMWLYGAAGAGKSAIAQTIAEQFNDRATLLASFFFSRMDPTRNNTGSRVATLAYQIALKLPDAKALVVAAIAHDPLIFSKSLETQFTRLIFEPLRSLSDLDQRSTHLIIIDGLDECEDGTRCDVLRLLMSADVQRSLPPIFRFLIASRPELDIKTIIDSQAWVTSPNRLDKFKEIKLNHPHRGCVPSEQWPSQNNVYYLVRNSSGQFIYASTVVNYISSQAHKPTNRLDVILGLRPARRDAPFAALDALYNHIFSTVDNLHAVLHVLGLFILGEHHQTVILEAMLGLEVGDIEVLFCTLGSILSFQENPYERSVPRVQILHKSLEDFLLDESRSKELYICPGAKHGEYAQILLQRMDNVIERTRLPESMCRSLVHHLQTAVPTPELYDGINEFTLDKVYDNYRETSDQSIASYFMTFVHDFLSYIKAWPGEDAEKLHALQQRRFDQLLIKRIGAYYADPRLTSLLAAISVDNLDFAAETQQYFEFIILVAKAAPDIDDEGLGIKDYHGYGIFYFTSYYRYLHQFLNDRTRCKTYALKPRHYAEAASNLHQLCLRPGLTQQEIRYAERLIRECLRRRNSADIPPPLLSTQSKSTLGSLKDHTSRNKGRKKGGFISWLRRKLWKS